MAGVSPGTPPTALASELIAAGVRGQALAEQMNAIVSRQIRFADLIEQLPDPEDRIVPCFDQVDALGLPPPAYSLPAGRLYPPWHRRRARHVSELIFQTMGASKSSMARNMKVQGM